jgi:hypothetical protein
MIIGIQFQEGRGRVEFTILPSYDKTCVPLWQIAAVYDPNDSSAVTPKPTLLITRGGPVSDASLTWFIQNKHNYAQKTAKIIRREAYQCQVDSRFTFPCPHREGPFMPPCKHLNRAEPRRMCASVKFSNFESALEPVGQMSLFKQNVTHKRVWTNPSGHRVEQALKPFWGTVTVCKERAIAAMELLKRYGDHPNVNEWEIRPIKDDPEWIAQQQERYAGRFRNCVFDEF